jgi:transcriptional regulator of acetoin/glycerol metabolism
MATLSTPIAMHPGPSATFPVGESFARPDTERDIFAAWERFVRGGDGASSHVRTVISESWSRCRGRTVDPGLARARSVVGLDELESHRERNRTLIEASGPVMAAARQFLCDSGSVLVLTDASGLIIDVEGDPATLERAQQVQLVAGVRWDESATGTNAIGTALAVGHPIQVHGTEHYCEGFKRWTCSSAVIRDPCDGTIVGTIDVSAMSRSYSRQSLAFAVSAATQVEGRLKQLELSQRCRILERCVPQLSAAHAEGIVLFDRRGYAVKVNGQAAAAMARRGRALTPDVALRVEALNLDEPSTRTPLPDWLPAARVEALADVGGERIGTLVALAVDGARPRPARPGPDRRPPGADPFAELVGSSELLRDAIERARMLASARAPVLLLGETGVGKDVFAQCIHRCGDEAGAPFVALNCAGLPRDLLASELFGYAEGAFTGARRGGMAGKIESADGGTLFLDEIGEMPLDLQGHLLRVLEAREVIRIGENRARKVDFRLISATNRDLRGEVAAGRFRMDLFYRVAVTSIRIAPLRDRAEDVAALAEHFARVFSRGARSFSPEALAALRTHAWPGNVRELRNVVESVMIASHREVLAPEDLPDEIREAMAHVAPRDSGTRMRDAEAEAIRVTMYEEGGNLTRAARRLGIAKSTLYLKITEYGLSTEVWRARERAHAPGLRSPASAPARGT